MSNPYESPLEAGVAAPPPDQRGKVGQIRIVAILMMVQGGLELLMGLFLLVMAVVLPMSLAANAETRQMTTMIIAVYAVMGVGAIIAAVLHALGGWKNYQLKSRQFGLISLIAGSVLSLATCYCCPTAIGLMIYGLIVYMDGPVEAAFANREAGGDVDKILAR